MTRHAIRSDLDGASVCVIGSGSGIGAAFTDRLMAQGSGDAFARRSDATEFCDAMEEAHGTRPLFLPCDVTETPALKAAIGRAAQAHRPLAVLVKNAANDKRHSALEVDQAFWNLSQAINLKGHLLTAQAAAS